MGAAPTPFAHILCAVDGSPDAEVAIEQALTLAGEDARLTFVTVSDSSGAPPAAEALSPALQAAERAGVTTVSLSLRSTDVHEAILAAAADQDLLVLATHGRHRRAEFLVGRTVIAALHASPVPVLVARPTPPLVPFPQAMLLATDCTPATDVAVTVTAALAARHGARLVLLYAGPGSREVRGTLAAEAAVLSELTGVEPVTLHLSGDPAARAVETAHELSSSLVVTGSGMRTGIRGLGSVSEPIASNAPCSVLVVRH
jgi:nucleotide-binding universal stress UspA family protein